MASITKQKTGWRVQISVKGQRDSAVRATKAEAQAWAVEREAQMRRIVQTGIDTGKTVQDAFDRYLETVSPRKRGAAWERTRLAFLAQNMAGDTALGKMRLCDVTSDVIAKWRDTCLAGVAKVRDPVLGSTINRDLALLSHVFTTARREWKWIAANPISDVSRPASPAARDKRFSDDDIKNILQALGYAGAARTKSDLVAVAFLFALETAMRAGEICALTRALVVGSVAHLPMTKNGTKRDVPLSGRALELLAQLPDTGPLYFGLTPSRLDALFRKGRDQALVGDLTFHDTRHEAITRLARKLNVLELARMVGHRDLKNLQIYYNATAAEIATRL